jgi:hypothetical protein
MNAPGGDRKPPAVLLGEEWSFRNAIFVGNPCQGFAKSGLEDFPGVCDV